MSSSSVSRLARRLRDDVVERAGSFLTGVAGHLSSVVSIDTGRKMSLSRLFDPDIRLKADIQPGRPP